MENEPSSVNVGERLRVLRGERGVSMRALARESGLSANALSMIERGLTSPSVSTLSKLANALGVPITAFFREEPVRSRIVFSKAGDRNELTFMRGRWEGLGGERFEGRVDAFLITLEGGANSGPHGMLHTGHELIYCLQGKIEYEVDGERFLLEPGDSLLFAARLMHRWRNLESGQSKGIVVISGFDESETPSSFHVASVSAEEAGEGIPDGLEGMSAPAAGGEEEA
ncbi:MAG TPA: cupin domain-containing protein [Anaerolineaceae bacterium]|nr:cupin domain-containing protein [Anaerolineaceae bacterium]